MRRLTPAEVRAAARRLALAAAAERRSCGDPEGEGVIRDLAREIDHIRLTGDPR